MRGVKSKVSVTFSEQNNPSPIIFDAWPCPLDEDFIVFEEMLKGHDAVFVSQLWI